MNKVLKWQQVIIDRVTKMSDRELFDAFADLSPDDYDGREQWEREYLRKELATKITDMSAVKQKAGEFISEHLSGEYCPTCQLYSFRHDSNCKAGKLDAALQNVRFHETRLR
jgi:ribosome biogenesis GTPase A